MKKLPRIRISRVWSRRTHMEEALVNSGKELHLATDQLSVAIASVDSEQRYSFTNKAYGQWVRRSSREMRGRHIREILGKAVYARIRGHVEAALSGQRVVFEARLPYREKGFRDVSVSYTPYFAEHGAVEGFVAVIEDITERKRTEDERHKLTRAVEQSPSIVIITDGDGNIEYINPKFTELTGYTTEEVIGKNPRILKSGETPPEEYKRLWETITSGGEWKGELHNKTKDGGFYWASASISPIRDGAGAITHFLAVQEDITERRQAEEALEHLAYHDALTGLPNRVLFMDRLTLALAQARRKKETLAVMFLDLDRFKVVNDSSGHSEGDNLLRGAGERLTGLMREGDTAARVGGDEFAILLSGIARVEDAVEVAERILEDLRRPWALDGHEFRVTASIGIALYPDDGEDAETLLKNADTAMYRAKERGRDDFQLYTQSMNVAILERLAVENDLRRALEREEFVIYYHPQVNIGTGRVVGMEALVRWQHPDRGLVLPAEFIPVAEETGLILPLGDWVLRTACAQNKAWQEAGLSTMRLAVNLSARQFQSRELVNVVTKILEETGLDPDCLQLEITEGVAMQDAEFAATMLRDLKAMGVQIAIDDFGTGHSSLGYLARFPVDALKIDRSFVGGLPMDECAAAITAAIITLAHSLNLCVIAEGVETEEQLAFLKERNCDEFQGFLFSKAWPAEAIEAVFMQGRSRSRPGASVDFPRAKRSGA